MRPRGHGAGLVWGRVEPARRPDDPRGTGSCSRRPTRGTCAGATARSRPSPKPVSDELVSVTTFPLLHPYKPSLFAAATRELDGGAKQLATRLGGTVKKAATVTLAGIKARQYELGYRSGGHDLHQRITFVLRGKTEFQLLCRWTGERAVACGQLEKTFRPL